VRARIQYLDNIETEDAWKAYNLNMVKNFDHLTPLVMKLKKKKIEDPRLSSQGEWRPLGGGANSAENKDEEWAHDDDSDGFSDEDGGNRAGIRPGKTPKQSKRPKVNFEYKSKRVNISTNVGSRLTALALKELGTAKNQFSTTIDGHDDRADEDRAFLDDANLEMQPLWGGARK